MLSFTEACIINEKCVSISEVQDYNQAFAVAAIMISKMHLHKFIQ